MCRILLSINPEHVNNIFNGTKRFEFRKTRCKKEITSIVIYSTSPVKKVVGEVTVNNILEKHPDEVWGETSEGAGIDRGFFDNYFHGKDRAIAYELDQVNIFEEPRSLSEYGIPCAPQSFKYLD